MGRSGPQPTPTAILEARGSRRALARRSAEDRPRTVTIPTKDESSLDQVASAKWDELIEHLAAIGVLSFVDKHLLHRYCTMYSQWSTCQEILRKRGGMTFPVKDAAGNVIDVRVFPEVYIASRLFDQMLKIEDRFGLSPSARVSLHTTAVLASQVVSGEGATAVEEQERSKERFFEDIR